MKKEDRQGLPPVTLGAVVLDCRDVWALSDFYIRLLGWERTYDEGEEWADVAPPGGGVKLAFQRNEDYVPPVWPEEPGRQQQMAHLDFAVEDREQMERAVRHALACGAVLAEVQYSDRWTVLLDPEGHPFCIVTAY